jgi:hypothetical protein
MAAQAFQLYNAAKKKIANKTISLAGPFRMTLHTSGSNAATLTLGLYGSLTNEVAEGNGYSSSGKALTGVVWTVGASAKSFKLDFDDITFTATGGTIPNIKFAAVWVSGASAGARHLLCRTSLTSNQFTLSLNNTVTIQINPLGAFTMQ